MRAKTGLSLFIIAVFLLNTGCTTIKPIDVNEQSTYAQHIRVDDKVRLLYLDGRVKEIKVTKVSEQEITGKLKSGGVVIADWRDIHEAERVTVSPLKTAGAALGIIVAIPVLAVLALASGCMGTYC